MYTLTETEYIMVCGSVFLSGKMNFRLITELYIAAPPGSHVMT